jgi:leucine dehydrogenase
LFESTVYICAAAYTANNDQGEGVQMFTIMQAAGLEALHLAQDPHTGLQAIIAVHNTHLGPALGGCRYLQYSDTYSAVSDAARLARGMSYKAALAGLPFGGGKAVLIRPPHVSSRAALFEAFGAFIETLNGRYITAVDSGTSAADMDCIAQRTQHVTSTTTAGDPSPHTAMGVFAGIRASALARLGSADLQGLRIAVQGLGHVGYALVEQLAAAGAELLVSDLDVGRLQLAVEQLGAHAVSAEALPSSPCDIFVPCGLGGVLNPQTVAQLHCAVVAGAANNQLSSPDVAEMLVARGILYAPDYVINSGGLIYVARTHQGAGLPEVTRHLAQIGQRLQDIYGHAQAENCSPARVADQLAERLLYPV